MNKHDKTEPSFFKWIRAAREEIRRDTEGMTAEEHVAYIHAKADESRRERILGNSEALNTEATPKSAKKRARKKTSARLVKA